MKDETGPRIADEPADGFQERRQGAKDRREAARVGGAKGPGYTPGRRVTDVQAAEIATLRFTKERLEETNAKLEAMIFRSRNGRYYLAGVFYCLNEDCPGHPEADKGCEP